MKPSKNHIWRKFKLAKADKGIRDYWDYHINSKYLERRVSKNLGKNIS